MRFIRVLMAPAEPAENALALGTLLVMGLSYPLRHYSWSALVTRTRLRDKFKDLKITNVSLLHVKLPLRGRQASHCLLKRLRSTLQKLTR